MIHRVDRSDDDEVGTAVEGWGRRSLGECAGQRTEKVIPTTVDTRPYVALEHLAQGRPSILGWSSAGSATSAKTVFFAGDVLFGKLRPNLKKAAAARFNGVCSTDILPLFGKDGLDSAYLLQLAQWGRFQQHAVATASGTKMPRTSWRQLGEFTFLCPPLNEQRKIAAVLSSVDDAIEKAQATVEQAQVVKRGVMQELFTRGLPGRHTRFRRTERVGINPSGWTILPLVDACVARGQYGANVAKRDFVPGGIRYIRITDIDEHGSLKDASVGIDAADAGGYLLEAGDILLARSGTVGKSYLHEDIRVRCAFAGYLVRFRTRDEVLLPSFLKEYLNTAAFWRWVADRQHAQAQPNVNAREYGQLPVPCPPLDEQRRIVDIAASFTGAIQSGRDKIRSLHLLKQSLLSVLLTGEVRVTVDTEAA